MRYTAALEALDADNHAPDFEAMSVRELLDWGAKHFADKTTPATQCDLGALFGVVHRLDEFCQDMNARNIERNEKIAALEKRCAELEARKLPMYAGVFEDGTAYCQSSLVTDRGGLWLAVRDTAQRPGGPNSGWRLVVKKGEA
jgi:hypothetical protein